MKRLLLVAWAVATACNGQDTRPDTPVDAAAEASYTDGAARDASKESQAMEASADAYPQTDAQTPHDDCMVTPAPNVLRVMTFNIQAARSYPLEEVADVINEANPDVVGLQEIDMGTTRSNGVYQLDELKKLTGMRGTFGKAIDYLGGEYGVGILTKGSLEDVRVDPLPGEGEKRVLLRATLRAKGGTWTFGVTHLGLTAEARNLQVEALKAQLASASNRIVVGDMNFEPGSAPYRALSQQLTDAWAGPNDEGNTSPALLPLKRIDYVFADDALLPALCSKVVHEVASDHLAVITSFGVH